MEGLLDLARGPLFRFSFAILALGLGRILILDLAGLVGAYRRTDDRNIPWGLTIRRSLEWWFPFKRVMHSRPLYSLLSILFHIGLIIVPLFLASHIRLWEATTGLTWWSLPDGIADILTITTVLAACGLLIGRLASRAASALSRKQDYLWPLILLIPFVTGFVCANLTISPSVYQFSMLLHILSGEVIFVLIPFTKIAHCVLMPLSQFVATLAWKFPPETDEAVAATLNKKGAPV
jgi:nitrate reductase gamma subunit